MKNCNKNEKYLLKFIAGNGCTMQENNDIIEIIHKLGIRLEFKNSNPVYQIIDELTYPALIGK